MYALSVLNFEPGLNYTREGAPQRKTFLMPTAEAGGLGKLTAAELEFIAEDQLVEIVPKFKHGPLHLIQGDFGPFVPQARTTVPLWLAITLKKRQK